jgi:hypothetical protein
VNLERDIAFWSPERLRQRDEILRGFTPFDVYCGTCLYVLAEPGPGCCRYVAPTPPRRSLFRRLFSGRKESR